MPFTSSDLNLSQDELDEITAALANDTNTDPIGDAIAQRLATITDYTRRFSLAEDRIKRLLKPLVIFDLYSNLNRVSDAQKRAFQSAMEELAQIRDGKFIDLPLASPAPQNTTGGKGAWGSRTKVDPR